MRIEVDSVILEADSDKEIQEPLKNAYDGHKDLFCLCSLGRPRLYLAKIEDSYVSKRWPHTGHEHDPSCDHYEPKLNPGQGVMGDAITENTDTGEFTLRVNFAFSKALPKGSKAKDEEKKEPAVKQGDAKASNPSFGLQSILSFLWEQARYNRWFPKMEGKRHWGNVSYNLKEAASHITTKGVKLSERMFFAQRLTEKNGRYINAALATFKHSLKNAKGKKTKLGIMIDQFNGIEQQGNLFQIHLKNLPNAPIMLTDKSMAGLERKFESQINAFDYGANVIAIAQVGLTDYGDLVYERLGLLVVDSNFLPFYGMHDKELIDQAVAERRRFIKPMRYELNDHINIPGITLIDTEEPIDIFVDTSTTDEPFEPVTDDPYRIWQPMNPNGRDLPAAISSDTRIDTTSPPESDGLDTSEIDPFDEPAFESQPEALAGEDDSDEMEITNKPPISASA